MSRLTDYKGHYCFLSCEETRGEEIKAKCNIYNQCLERKVYDKLAHYEDLEEQGRLVVLPCKVGDKVYFIRPTDFKPELTETEVEKLVLKKRGWHMKLECNSFYETTCNSIGKTVFFTKEEAEAKLAELKEGTE